MNSSERKKINLIVIPVVAMIAISILIIPGNVEASSSENDDILYAPYDEDYYAEVEYNGEADTSENLDADLENSLAISAEVSNVKTYHEDAREDGTHVNIFLSLVATSQWDLEVYDPDRGIKQRKIQGLGETHIYAEQDVDEESNMRLSFNERYTAGCENYSTEPDEDWDLEDIDSKQEAVTYWAWSTVIDEAELVPGFMNAVETYEAWKNNQGFKENYVGEDEVIGPGAAGIEPDVKRNYPDDEYDTPTTHYFSTMLQWEIPSGEGLNDGSNTLELDAKNIMETKRFNGRTENEEGARSSIEITIKQPEIDSVDTYSDRSVQTRDGTFYIDDQITTLPSSDVMVDIEVDWGDGTVDTFENKFVKTMDRRGICIDHTYDLKELGLSKGEQETFDVEVTVELSDSYGGLYDSATSTYSITISWVDYNPPPRPPPGGAFPRSYPL